MFDINTITQFDDGDSDDGDDDGDDGDVDDDDGDGDDGFPRGFYLLFDLGWCSSMGS